MKKLLFVFLLFNAAILFCQEQFRLVWEENFDTCCIDRNRWQTKYPWGRNLPANRELQFYTDGQNFQLEDGLLRIRVDKSKITARIDSAYSDNHLFFDSIPNLQTFSHTSGMLYSLEKFEYGKFEIKCKVPKGIGMWPAFWLYGDMPQNEIDIFEFYGEKRRKLFFTIHFFDEVRKHFSTGLFTKNKKAFYKSFITVTLEWTPDSLKFYLNNELSRVMNVSFKGEKNLIVNLALSENAALLPARAYPKYFDVDYIRVWKYIGDKNH